MPNIASEVDVSTSNPLVKNASKGKKEKKDKDNIHSITFYIPRIKMSFYSETLKALATLDHGTEKTSGKVSQYLRGLIDKDLTSRGLLNDSGEPKMDALAVLKTKLNPSAVA